MRRCDQTVILTNLEQIHSSFTLKERVLILIIQRLEAFFIIMQETMKIKIMSIFLTHGVFITALYRDGDNMIQRIVKKNNN